MRTFWFQRWRSIDHASVGQPVRGWCSSAAANKRQAKVGLASISRSKAHNWPSRTAVLLRFSAATFNDRDWAVEGAGEDGAALNPLMPARVAECCSRICQRKPSG